MNINYSRIANMLHSEEKKAIASNDLKRFEIVHKKLNRLFLAWGKSYKSYKKISELKSKTVFVK